MRKLRHRRVPGASLTQVEVLVKLPKRVGLHGRWCRRPQAGPRTPASPVSALLTVKPPRWGVPRTVGATNFGSSPSRTVCRTPPFSQTRPCLRAWDIWARKLQGALCPAGGEAAPLGPRGMSAPTCPGVTATGGSGWRPPGPEWGQGSRSRRPLTGSPQAFASIQALPGGGAQGPPPQPDADAPASGSGGKSVPCCTTSNICTTKDVPCEPAARTRRLLRGRRARPAVLGAPASSRQQPAARAPRSTFQGSPGRPAFVCRPVRTPGASG